jgi:hypothetical protein
MLPIFSLISRYVTGIENKSFQTRKYMNSRNVYVYGFVAVFLSSYTDSRFANLGVLKPRYLGLFTYTYTEARNWLETVIFSESP